MAYTINKTTGEILITIPDGQADGPSINPGLNVSDVDLFGKNYPLYGEFLDENFIKLLQNFASTIPPQKPLEGELWYDISVADNQILRIFNGTSWLPVTPVWVSPNAPTTTQIGAQWWDSTNYQLNMYNGSNWTLIGPGYKNPDGKSGAIVENVTDTNNLTHTVIKFYTNNNVLAIACYDQPFTLASTSAVDGFSVISPGITLAAEANNLFYGTATNSQNLGNIAAINYARRDIDSLFYGNIMLGGGTFDVNVEATTTKIINSLINSSTDFYTNRGGVPTRVLHLDGVSGEVTTAQDPTTSLGVVTRQFMESSISTAIAPLATKDSPVFSGIPLAPNVAAPFTSTTGQIATMRSVWGAIGTSQINTVLQGNIKIFANSIVGSIQAFTVNGITGQVTVAADPTTNLGVTTKQYVDNTVATAVSPLAPINSPVFTGAPKAPSPLATDTSKLVATMESVQNAIAVSNQAMWLGSRKTISTSAPTPGAGNPGDFWFQV